MLTGDLELAAISIPRYLNYVHYYNLILLTYKSPVQCNNMTSVFLVFMTKSLHLQNEEKRDKSFYNASTLGAINTISSAKASINKVRPAMVNSLH